MKQIKWLIWIGILGGSLGLIWLGMAVKRPTQPILFKPILTSENQNSRSTINSLKPVEERGDQCKLRPIFSQSIQVWCRFIQSSAQENKLDPNLIASVMTQESGGNPYAVSSSGAVGLLQVMPKDGKAAFYICTSGPCFADRPTSRELYNPQFNIAYGSKLLAGLIQHYGNIREALRAYGPLDVGFDYADTVLEIFNLKPSAS